MDGKTAQEQHQRQQARLGQLLLSEAGKDLLTELEKEFDPDDITGKSVEETYFNLGARHVVRFLKSLRKLAQKE